MNATLSTPEKLESAVTAASAEILERNLAALQGVGTRAAGGGRSAGAIAAIRAAGESSTILDVALKGGLTGTIEVRGKNGVRTHRLASAVDPSLEGTRFAKSIDLAKAAAIVLRGFGVGAHVEALAKRVKFAGAIIVYEPDAALLRAVLERVDCSDWLRMANIAIVTDATDTGAIAAATQTIEGILAAGTQLIDHPPSKARLGASADVFGENFATVMKAVRTNVLTTLVQVDVTVRNYLQNAEWYVTRAGIADLEGVAKGAAAVVVSAGPSLRRNVDVLAEEVRNGLRDRAVIIAAQTVLKTLLAKGVKPHFVTALDYHEISRRFYEGLTAKDVEGVTLLAEPKCNPAILEAWPGAIRLVGNEVLDQIVGEELVNEIGAKGEITPGATVAHLSYYLARYLGCDPVILIGQDLGFTDGQYYAPGAAIHQVWSNELNEFNTLEMLEWQRIARMRSLLRKVQDQHGRSIYTDEQMATYLVQFERDFAKDVERGLTVIDATEGGVMKRHTRVQTLREALARHAAQRGATARFEAAEAKVGPRGDASNATLARKTRLKERLATLRKDAATLASVSDDTASLLSQMMKGPADQARINQLIGRTHKNAERAMGLSAYWLTQYINQTGQLNRYRADRSIAIDDSLTPVQKQRKQIERDLVNVRWIADAARHTGGLVCEAIEALDTGVRVTKDETPTTDTGEGPRKTTKVKVAACVWVDPDRGGLGNRRDLAEIIAPNQNGRGNGLNVLEATLSRLARCKTLDRVVLVTPMGSKQAVTALLTSASSGLKVEIVEAAVDDAARRRSVAIGRLWARHCWRGGLADLSCFDEAFSPAALRPVLAAMNLDAAIVVGADWCLVDPALVDAVVARHRENPEGLPLVFTPTPTGLGACLISRALVEECAKAPSAFATIGGMVGYVPIAPQGDPIAKPACVSVPPHVRDFLERVVADSPAMLSAMRALMHGESCGASGSDWTQMSAEDVVRAIGGTAGTETITVGANDGDVDAEIDRAITIVQSSNRPVGVTIDLRGVSSDSWTAWAPRTIERLRQTAAGVHLRLDALTIDDAKALLRDDSTTWPDIVSIECVADNAETFEALSGIHAERFTENRAAIDWLLDRRGELDRESGGLPSVWVVPRITRRDAVYEQIEGFYNRALLTTGAAVIDPLPAPTPGERIEPLPVPANVTHKRAATHVTISTASDVTATTTRKEAA